MILYLDSSSLVKLYVEEAGSDSVRRQVTEASRIAVSILAYPEARSAFARRRREGGLAPARCAVVCNAAERRSPPSIAD